MQTNIFFVGVSGVGKTTLGFFIAKELGMDFYSMDNAYLEEKGAHWDVLDQEMGSTAVNEELLQFSKQRIRSLKNCLIDTSPRCYHFPELWPFMKERGASIHLAGKVRDTLERVNSRQFSNPRKKEKHFNHRWMDHMRKPEQKIWQYDGFLAHSLPCLNADFTLHIEGNEGIDGYRLFAKTKAVKDWLANR
ncbi:MAG: aroK 2 [Chlamydiales bacterium]|nr:aroK 2 [Chlamydiales bacterium]